MPERLRCLTGLIATPSINSETGLYKLIENVQYTLGGQGGVWGKRDRNSGKVIRDPTLTVRDVQSNEAFYGDYRLWWSQGKTESCSENWTLYLLERNGREHFIVIDRCGELTYNNLFVSTNYSDETTLESYIKFTDTFYAKVKPYYAFVDSGDSLPNRADYEKKRFPIFWANWYSRELLADTDIQIDFSNLPVYQARKLPDGGMFVRTTESLRDHVRDGWSPELKQHFKGSRILWARYDEE